MNKVLTSERFAAMWRKSREDAGKSQAYMAKALGVSKKTIQNWEDGTSCPNQLKGFEWFHALDLQPLPYYLQLLYPEFDGISYASSDDCISQSLLVLVAALPVDQQRKLLYILYGDHGSDTRAVVELSTAYLHVPLRYRVNIAQSVLTNYELTIANGNDVCPDHIQPDKQFLADAIQQGISAILNGNDTYSMSMIL